MKVGDLCKIRKENTHIICQQGDLVLITKIIGSVYAEGINLKTCKFHHYCKDELEVINDN
tara:strand:+ start:404 stop:583 length:180 start_codon:yes stop_codon:yes gene_type:complete